MIIFIISCCLRLANILLILMLILIWVENFLYIVILLIRLININFFENLSYIFTKTNNNANKEIEFYFISCS